MAAQLKSVSTHIWVNAKVDANLLSTITSNPGCAEKRVLSAAREFSDIVQEISITEHPIGSNPALLKNYAKVIKPQTYYLPCDSCRDFAKNAGYK